MFKSKLRFQIRHEDFRQRISQDEEDINSILNWYKLTDAVFLDYLSQVNILRQSQARTIVQSIFSFRQHFKRCREIKKELFSERSEPSPHEPRTKIFLSLTLKPFKAFEVNFSTRRRRSWQTPVPCGDISSGTRYLLHANIEISILGIQQIRH